MKKDVIWVGLFLFVFVPRLAFAKPDLKKYIDFAQQWTPYAYHGEPLPKIKVVRQDLVDVFAYGDLVVAQAESKDVKLPAVNSVYLVEDKTIYISDELDLNDPKIEVTYAHEIVHYLQDINGYSKSLNGRLICTESEAYDVQILWQKINNVDPETIPYASQQSMLAAIKCQRNKSAAFGYSSKINF